MSPCFVLTLRGEKPESRSKPTILSTSNPPRPHKRWVVPGLIRGGAHPGYTSRISNEDSYVFFKNMRHPSFSCLNYSIRRCIRKPQVWNTSQLYKLTSLCLSKSQVRANIFIPSPVESFQSRQFMSVFTHSRFVSIDKMTLECILCLIAHRPAHVWPVRETGGGASAERESREEKERKEKEEREAQPGEETWLGSGERGRHHASSHGWHCYRGDARGMAEPHKRPLTGKTWWSRHDKIGFIKCASDGHSNNGNNHLWVSWFSSCCCQSIYSPHNLINFRTLYPVMMMTETLTILIKPSTLTWTSESFPYKSRSFSRFLCRPTSYTKYM